MTSFRTPLRLIGAVLVLLVVLQSAYAQTYEGETPVDMARGMADENGDIVRFRALTINWRFAGLMGEPLRQFAGRYEHHSPPWVELAGAPVCFAQHVVASFRPKKIEPDMVSEGALDGVDLYTHSRFRMIIEPNSNLGFALGPSNVIQHYFGVDSFSQGADYGPSVPGSPEWDRLFQVGPVGSEDISWLSEAQARELFRVGFSVSRIDMVEPKYALALVKASYERHFRAKPCGDRPVEPLAEEEAEGDEPAPEQVASDEAGVDDAVEPDGDLAPPVATPDQPKPQTAADRLDAMLNRVAEAREEEREASESENSGPPTIGVSSSSDAPSPEVEISEADDTGRKIAPASDDLLTIFGGQHLARFSCEPRPSDFDPRACHLALMDPGGTALSIFGNSEHKNRPSHSVDYNMTLLFQEYLESYHWSAEQIDRYIVYSHDDFVRNKYHNLHICADLSNPSTDGYQEIKSVIASFYFINERSALKPVAVSFHENRCDVWSYDDIGKESGFKYGATIDGAIRLIPYTLTNFIIVSNYK